MTNLEKQFYDSLLKRLKKAEKYMDNNEIAIEEREKHVEKLYELMKIVSILNKYFKIEEDDFDEDYI